MELILILAFWAWVLTILAPCVLPLLPVIIGSSIEDEDKTRPYIIVFSLALSLVLFSLILKVSTAFIWVSDTFWKTVSWWIVIAFWIITLFPNLWENISTKLGFSSKSNEILASSTGKKWKTWSVLIWMSLWPVFASCSPTYSLIISIVIAQNFAIWVLALVFYSLGLSLVMLLIAKLWQKFVAKARILANPNWMFKKVLWVIFILVWIAILTWADKVFEGYLLDNWYLDLTEFEDKILDNSWIKDELKN